MPDTLLHTKITIPALRPNIIIREGLLNQLNAGLDYPFTLISCPAGYGKTTLLTTWVHQVGLPVAWLTLDEDDGDFTRFLRYLYAAVRRIAPDLPDGQFGLLRQSRNILHATLTPLINHLVQMPGPFVIVLDDYHEVNSSAVHDAVIYLLEHAPAQANMVISSRADPPFPLARMRVRGQLHEVRVTDLRFTLDEVEEFVNHVMGLSLRPGDIAALEARTEGWIAGLQLAALSMQGKPDRTAFIAGFTGSHEYIVDYLTDEVLEQQPEETRKFLLLTSILNRLSGPLCDAVTGGEQGQEMLEALDSANLFVMSLDDHRQWYRYHRLFSDLLRQRLQQAAPESIFDLHARASVWYESQNFIIEAVDHALDGGLYERAVVLISRIAESTLLRGEIMTLLGWIAQLPEDLLYAHPSLCLFHAWAAVLDGQSLEAIEARLERAVGLDQAKADSFRAFAALFRGQPGEAHRLAKQALGHISEDEPFLLSAATWILNLSDIVDTDLSSTRERLEDVVSRLEAAGNFMMTIMTLSNIAEMAMRQGQLHQSHEMFKHVLSIARDPEGELLPISVMALSGLAGIEREWGNFEAAKDYIRQAEPLGSSFSKGSGIEVSIHKALICQSQRDYEASQAAFTKAVELAVDYEASELDDQFVDLLQTRLWIVQGRLDDAARRAKAIGFDSDLDVNQVTSHYNYHLFHHEYLTSARLWLAKGELLRALAVLDGLRELLGVWGWGQSRREIEVHVLRAVTLHLLGKKAQALSALQTALEMAEPGGYIRTFVDEGTPMAALLADAAARGIMPGYVGRLLDAFAAEEALQPGVSRGLHDPLSERELEVLRLIADGLSNPDIARRLYLAVGTVKAHTSSIYSKLRVKNRVQAVERAHELNLV